jgi:hypothetical protein
VNAAGWNSATCDAPVASGLCSAALHCSFPERAVLLDHGPAIGPIVSDAYRPFGGRPGVACYVSVPNSFRSSLRQSLMTFDCTLNTIVARPSGS